MKSNDEEMQNSDPEDLGQRAAQDAFNSLSLGQSEQMSFEDFKKWFSTLDLSKRTSDVEPQDTKEKGETLSLAELRMITRLKDMTVEDLEIFWKGYMDNESGTLSRSQFSQGFSELVHLDRMSEVDASRIRSTCGRCRITNTTKTPTLKHQHRHSRRIVQLFRYRQ